MQSKPNVAAAIAPKNVRKRSSSRLQPDRIKKMEEMYNAGQTLGQIGEHFDLSRQRVHQIFDKNGIKSLGLRKAETPPLTDIQKRIAQEYDEGISPSSIMEKYKISYATVHNIRKKAGIALKPKGFFVRRPDYEEISDGIISDYSAGVSTREIAVRYGLCSSTEIYKFIQRAGITPHSFRKKT